MPDSAESQRGDQPVMQTPAHAPLSRGAAYGVFAVLVLIWGLNWPIMKMVVHLMPPLWFVVARLALGALCLFGLLASNPQMGQEEPDLGDGIRRFLYEAHIVFYRPVTDGVLIVDLKGVRQQSPSTPGRNKR